MSGGYPSAPWEAEHGADGFYLVTHDGGIPLEDDTDVVERLIGAAPELLEAAQAFLAYDDGDWSEDLGGMMVAYDEALTKARAAIAKATAA